MSTCLSANDSFGLCPSGPFCRAKNVQPAAGTQHSSVSIPLNPKSETEEYKMVEINLRKH